MKKQTCDMCKDELPNTSLDYMTIKMKSNIQRVPIGALFETEPITFKLCVDCREKLLKQIRSAV